MTISICLKCGEFKQNSLMACSICGYCPNTLKDAAQHMLCTQFLCPIEQLQDYSKLIKAGEQIEFDENDPIYKLFLEQLKESDKLKGILYE